MCVSPQRRAFFEHLNFKKCSGPLMFCAFSLPNVRFVKAACNFWFLCWAPTSAPAALTGLLFDWPDTRIIEKHSISRLLFHLARMYLLSSDFLAIASSFCWLDYPTLLFNCPYCGKFLFKLPSIIWPDVSLDLGSYFRPNQSLDLAAGTFPSMKVGQANHVPETSILQPWTKNAPENFKS